MHRVLLSVLLSAALVAAGSSAAWALQSGGVAYGDLATGKVSGYDFKTMGVDVAFHIMDVSGTKITYPPLALLDLKNAGTGGARFGEPVLLSVTNHTKAEHGFDLSADSPYAAPTSMHVKTVVKPGESKSSCSTIIGL